MSALKVIAIILVIAYVLYILFKDDVDEMMGNIGETIRGGFNG